MPRLLKTWRYCKQLPLGGESRGNLPCGVAPSPFLRLQCPDSHRPAGSRLLRSEMSQLTTFLGTAQCPSG